jgi:hypothetical protein
VLALHGCANQRRKLAPLAESTVAVAGQIDDLAVAQRPKAIHNQAHDERDLLAILQRATHGSPTGRVALAATWIGPSWQRRLSGP